MVLRCVQVFWVASFWIGLTAVAADAGPQSLVAGQGFARARTPLIDMGRSTSDDGLLPQAVSLIQPSGGALIAPRAEAVTAGRGGSLFHDEPGARLFDPVPDRDRAASMRMLRPLAGFSSSGIAALRDLIASAEAGRAGYDAVQYGARVKPRKAPTQMTIAEIYAWIERTPGQPHAIGRYQFIPSTLRRLVAQLGVSEGARFSPQVQDLLADRLLEDAGMSGFLKGEVSQTSFMNNIAKIWAGLPNSSGRSHYHGYAGNKATMTWARFKSEMTRIFPRG